MGFSGDTRAVTVQIGAVLLFGFIIVALTVYQATAVPAQNKRVEFNHNQEVQNQLQNLRNALVGTAASGTGQPASVSLGTRYSERIFFVNPPPASGTVRTVPLGERSAIRVENTRAKDPETADYWHGVREFETEGMAYRPEYNVYANAPTTVYENSVLANEYEGGQVAQTGQLLVDGDTLTLVTLNGTLYESGVGSVSVDPEAVSAPYRTVPIEDTGANPVLRIPTRLSNETWTTLLEGQANVTRWETNADRGVVNVTLTRGSYDLRMAKVGVGTGINRSGSGAKYLTLVEGNGTDAVTVEARDRFNNPVSGVTVTASNHGGNLAETSVETGDDGRAMFSASATQRNVELSIDDGNVDYERTVVDFVESGGNGGGNGGGSTGNINPNDDGAVVLQDEAIYDDSTTCQDTSSCKVVITLNNTGGETHTIRKMRYNFYSADTQNGKVDDLPKGVMINGTTLEMRGPYKSVGTSNPTVPPGTKRFGMCFFESKAATTDYGVGEGDFFILSVEFDNGSATYFVPPLDGSGSAPGCTASGGITLDDADVSTGGGIAIDAKGGALSATGASIATSNDRSISLSSNGDMALVNADISAPTNSGQITADLRTKSATLYVAGASVDDGDDTLVYDPNNINVDGENSMSSGSVSKN